MQHLVFEFDSEKDLRDTVNKLWDVMGVSGELQIRPKKDGKWHLEVHTEKEVRENSLEKFQAFRVESGD